MELSDHIIAFPYGDAPPGEEEVQVLFDILRSIVDKYLRKEDSLSDPGCISLEEDFVFIGSGRCLTALEDVVMGAGYNGSVEGAGVRRHGLACGWVGVEGRSGDGGKVKWLWKTATDPSIVNSSPVIQQESLALLNLIAANRTVAARVVKVWKEWMKEDPTRNVVDILLNVDTYRSCEHVLGLLARAGVGEDPIDYAKVVVGRSTLLSKAELPGYDEEDFEEWSEAAVLREYLSHREVFLAGVFFQLPSVGGSLGQLFLHPPTQGNGWNPRSSGMVHRVARFLSSTPFTVTNVTLGTSMVGTLHLDRISLTLVPDDDPNVTCATMRIGLSSMVLMSKSLRQINIVDNQIIDGAPKEIFWEITCTDEDAVERMFSMIHKFRSTSNSCAAVAKPTHTGPKSLGWQSTSPVVPKAGGRSVQPVLDSSPTPPDPSWDMSPRWLRCFSTRTTDWMDLHLRPRQVCWWCDDERW